MPAFEVSAFAALDRGEPPASSDHSHFAPGDRSHDRSTPRPFGTRRCSACVSAHARGLDSQSRASPSGKTVLVAHDPTITCHLARRDLPKWVRRTSNRFDPGPGQHPCRFPFIRAVLAQRRGFQENASRQFRRMRSSTHQFARQSTNIRRSISTKRPSMPTTRGPAA